MPEYVTREDLPCDRHIDQLARLETKQDTCAAMLDKIWTKLERVSDRSLVNKTKIAAWAAIGGGISGGVIVILKHVIGG